MNLNTLKLYLFEGLKLAGVYLIIRLFLDWLRRSEGYNLYDSIRDHAESALVFGAIMGVVRVMMKKDRASADPGENP